MNLFSHKYRLLYFTVLLSTYVFAQNETFAWAKKLGGTSSEVGYDITTDTEGNVYTAGLFWHICDFDPGPNIQNFVSNGDSDIYIQKLNSEGELEWTKHIGGYGYDGARALTTDNNGNIYINGYVEGTLNLDTDSQAFNVTSSNEHNSFILKLTTNGDFVWLKQINGGFFTDITRDDDGNLYNVGHFTTPIDFDPDSTVYQLTPEGDTDMFIHKIDSNGNFLWVSQTGGDYLVFNNSVQLDNDGYIYSTGDFNGTIDFNPGIGIHNLTSVSFNDTYILKTDPENGDMVWVKHLSGTGNIKSTSIAIDTNKNIYTTGYFQSTADFNPNGGSFQLTSFGVNDIFVLKLDSTGNFIWANQSGGSFDDLGYSITTNLNNELYITGSFSDEADLDPSNNQLNFTSSGNKDVFIQKLNTNGDLIWAKSMGSTHRDYGNRITTDIHDNLFTLGQFYYTIDFDMSDYVYNVTGSVQDIFIQKLYGCNVNTVDTIISCEPYTWTNGITYTESNYTAQQRYENINGCDSTIFLNLTIPDISETLLTAGTFITSAHNAGTYQWLDCNNSLAPIPNETNQTITGVAGGNYAVEITENGCVDTSICMTLANIGLDEVSFSDQFILSPNPVNTNLSIKSLNKVNQIHIRIVSLLGQEVLNNTFQNTDHISIDLTIPNGIYFAELSDDNAHKTSIKFIKR